MTPRRRSLSTVLAAAATERREFHRTESDASTGVVSPPIIPDSPLRFGRGAVDRFIAKTGMKRKKRRPRTINKMKVLQKPTILTSFQTDLLQLMIQYEASCVLNMDASDSSTAESTTQAYTWMIPGLAANCGTGVNTNTRFHVLNTVCADGTTLKPMMVTAKAKTTELSMACNSYIDEVYDVGELDDQSMFVHANKGGTIHIH